MKSWPWSTLGIDPTDDKSAIRKAYAERLKSLDIDNEINAFSDLRSARDYALSNVGWNVPDTAGNDPATEENFDLADGDAVDDYDYHDDFGDDDLFSLDFDAFGAPNLGGFGFGFKQSANPDLSAIESAADTVGESGPLGVADHRLTQLLFPGGAQSDDAMEWEEFEEAQAAQTALLDHASQTDLQSEQSIDYWLGDILAEAWPRSAPLVEQASNAFGWMGEAGQLNERPALVWLNARLGGMRFHEQVQQASHSSHDAWAYLTKPGEYRWWHSVTITGTSPSDLISDIRSNHPELESYLEPRKVAAFEDGVTGFMPGLIRLLFVLFLMTIPIRMCSGDMDRTTDTSPPIIETTMQNSPQVPASAEQITKDLFGQEASFEAIEQRNTVIAQHIRVSAIALQLDGRLASDAAGGAEKLVRTLTLLSAASAELEELLAITQVKLDLLRQAKSVGANTVGANPAGANPPGASGCNVQIALLQSAVPQPGRAPADLLRMY